MRFGMHLTWIELPRCVAPSWKNVQSRVARLTQRQRQIMTRMLDGRLNKQIAAELELSENTVKVHRRRIMERMRAANFAELVHMIELLGWKRGLHQSN
jgi:FixJ family two-component response regulator